MDLDLSLAGIEDALAHRPCLPEHPRNVAERLTRRNASACARALDSGVVRAGSRAYPI